MRRCWNLSYHQKIKHQRRLDRNVPGEDVIKLNLDGAVNDRDWVTSSGGVARDAAGMFRGAW
jgi:hypothetical protein